ncbi:MAG: hypothetical protein IPL27_28815 [Lewinellaceae bacterium]|nr:hypothetical protein [Lewinellaceae bacterium]
MSLDKAHHRLAVQNAINATEFIEANYCSNIVSGMADDVWFKFTAVSTTIIITVNPSSGYDPAVELSSGACNNLYPLRCSDNGGGNGYQEILSYDDLIVGTTYRIRVYDYGNISPATTTFSISVWSEGTSGSSEIDFSQNSLNFNSVPISAGSVTKKH